MNFELAAAAAAAAATAADAAADAAAADYSSPLLATPRQGRAADAADAPLAPSPSLSRALALTHSLDLSRSLSLSHSLGRARSPLALSLRAHPENPTHGERERDRSTMRGGDDTPRGTDRRSFDARSPLPPPPPLLLLLLLLLVLVLLVLLLLLPLPPLLYAPVTLQPPGGHSAARACTCTYAHRDMYASVCVSVYVYVRENVRRSLRRGRERERACDWLPSGGDCRALVTRHSSPRAPRVCARARAHTYTRDVALSPCVASCNFRDFSLARRYSH